MAEKRVKLGFTHGTSDKVYYIKLMKNDDGGYQVWVAYGKRGRVHHYSPKDSSPVPRSVAEETYDKLLAQKLKKGYQIEG